MIINNSINKTIHTQRNNKIRPYSACNVTSFINALNCCNIEFYYPDDMQPEDYFMQLMNTEDSWERLYEIYGRNVGANPWNFSEILVEVCNEVLVKDQVCEIKYATIEQIKEHLDNKDVLTTSGAFTRSGHFVCVVGYEAIRGKIKNFIIDDPYGNYHKQYKDFNGDNIKMPIKDFMSIIKPRYQAAKRTQFFYRG